ncbi:FAD-dependent oxidoreductase [Phenylobacterium montanum]|uniref:FAD-dependent monooxygenase n=1 Tax=Phenylobacterium montanum TaxID=2823693 RepID=A0A975IWE5_9CAUL|nr:NAD(P)/FAD-dependent oxidoreductase [Caulobacter sp. S6]QUD89504.1 FAD-dependent monooxygenase [Caulobacter sp. S6]
MSDVLVIGAGFAGLYSALMLARRGHAVTVLEKDPEAPPADGEACFTDWVRRGVAQARQPHILLNRAARVLQDETPAVLAAFADAGANLLTAGGERVAPDERDRLFFTCSRRLPLEAVLRRAVLAEPQVELRTGEEASGLVLLNGRVRGVLLRDHTEIRAELVVDCAGRWSRSRDWLMAEGVRLDPERRQDCDFFYLTQWRRRTNADFSWGGVPGRAESAFASFRCFPADGAVFAATMVLSMHDPLKAKCRKSAVFERVFGAIPGFQRWLEGSEPISELEVTARIENCWRSTLDEKRPAVSGFVLLGDSAMHTNPTLGRGVALALLQARQLADLLERHDAGSPDLVAEFETWRSDELSVWYLSQAAANARRSEEMRHTATGGETQEPVGEQARFAAAMAIAAAEDPYVAERALELFHLLATPAEVAADLRVRKAAQSVLERGVPLRPLTSGPGRTEFERMLE